MKNHIIIAATMSVCFLLFGCMNHQIILSGYVKDDITGQPIIKAVVSDGTYGEGNFDITDESGYYSYETYCEEHTIEVSADGYKNDNITVITPMIPNSSPITMDIMLKKD
jgi:hypothetical protein